ncbi:hypothetical protein [Limosilactobacillus caviae]|uniref:hypothetical protein n=1 Tax=Limosilactobacillus caviae TaxID=1769424 RepID=UPI001E5C4556|nr:hypothetical protein [Limosilactobacillus caviae]
MPSSGLVGVVGLVGTANNVSAKTLLSIAEVLKTSMDNLANGSTDEAEMGYYQKKLWQALNKMDDEKAEQVSKNVLGLINLNKE